MPEFPIPSARILLVCQIQEGQLPPCPSVRYAYAFSAVKSVVFCLMVDQNAFGGLTRDWIWKFEPFIAESRVRLWRL